MGADLVQLAAGSAILFVLASVLTPAEVGYFGGAVAIGGIIGSLGSLGAPQLLVERISRGSSFEKEWPATVATLTGGTIVGWLALLAMRPLVIPQVSMLTFGLLIASQVNFYWLIELTVFAAQAERRLAVGAATRLVNSAARVAGLIVFMLVGADSLSQWAWYAFVANGISCVVALLIVGRAFSTTRHIGRPSRADLRAGLPYVLTMTSTGMLDASDRPLLLRYNYDDDAGRYSLAYRLVSIGIVPVLALIRASEADFFEKGARSVGEAVAHARRLLPIAVAYGALAWLGLFLVAPVVPMLLPSDYADTTTMVRLLAVLPAIKGVQLLGAMALTGAGKHTQRVGYLIGAAVLNLVLNLMLIPTYSWKGAIATTLIAEGAFTIALWISAWRSAANETPPDHANYESGSTSILRG